MWHETPGGGHEANDVICQQVGFDGGDSETLDFFQFIQFPYQVEERFSCLSTEIPRIYSRKNDFLDTLGRHVLGCLEHVLNGSTAATSASERNGTVGTEIVTPVLDFQETPGSVSV